MLPDTGTRSRQLNTVCVQRVPDVGDLVPWSTEWSQSRYHVVQRGAVGAMGGIGGPARARVVY